MPCAGCPVGHCPGMTDELRSQILSALDALESPAATADAMVKALTVLDTICVQQGRVLPGDLAHYLQRRSYAKARAALADPGMGHVC